MLAGERSSERGISPARGRRRIWLTGVVLAVFWVGGMATWAGAAPSIFDDDWVPPKRSDPKPAPVKPEAPGKRGTAPETKKPPAQGNVERVVPGEKVETTPPVVSEPVTPVKKRRAVPSKAAQAQARKLLREVFAKELSEHAPEARRVLAERFLSEAEKAADQPVDEFVLLGGAYQAAREGNDLELCMRAIDEMAGTFDVDALDMKLGALSAISSGGDPAKARAAVMAGLKVLDETVAVDDYDGAREAATRIEQAAARAGDASLAGYAREKAKEARRIGVEYERVRKEMAIAAAARDARANGAIGRFLCFFKEDWQNGLPFLAMGDDVILQAAAEEELAAGSDARALRLAEDWWAVGEKASGATRTAIEHHAGVHYLAAFKTLEGLEKLRVGKRLAEVMPFSFSMGEVYDWSRGKEAVEMIPQSQGICVLTRIGGGFHGTGEEVGIGVVGSSWRLAGRAGADPFASATALMTPGAGVFRAPVSYTWKKGDAPVRMIRTDEGICVLSGILGGLRGGGEEVRVYPGEDGYWYLGGKAGVSLTVHALAIRPVKPNTFRALYDEAVWTSKTGPTRMIRQDEGFCFLSGVGGCYEGDSEIARVEVGDDGYWYLKGQTRQGSMTARAISVRIVERRP